MPPDQCARRGTQYRRHGERGTLTNQSRCLTAGRLPRPAPSATCPGAACPEAPLTSRHLAHLYPAVQVCRSRQRRSTVCLAPGIYPAGKLDVDAPLQPLAAPASGPSGRNTDPACCSLHGHPDPHGAVARVAQRCKRTLPGASLQVGTTTTDITWQLEWVGTRRTPPCEQRSSVPGGLIAAVVVTAGQPDRSAPPTNNSAEVAGSSLRGQPPCTTL